MKKIRTVKFKKVSFFIRFVLLLAILGLMFKVHISLVDVLAIPYPFSLLQSYIGEIMFMVSVVIYSIVIYAPKNVFFKVVKYLLMILPLFILARSFYLEKQYVVSSIFVVWVFLTLVLLLIAVYKRFSMSKIFDYWNELFTFLLFLTPGILIILARLEVIMIEDCSYTTIQAILFLLISVLTLLLILVNMQEKSTSSKAFIVIFLIISSGILSYTFFEQSYFMLTLFGGFHMVWLPIENLLKEKDFKLNG